MRWYWIDRFLEFESGRFAKAVKCISLAEDHLHDHFADYPMIPNSLVIEGLAQTGGLLICEHNQFAKKVVLAKISSARFFCEATPGDTLTYATTIEYMNDEGAMISGTSHKGDKLHAEVQLFFAHLNDPRMEGLFDPDAFLSMMMLLKAYDVGRAADGSRMVPPERLLKAAQPCDGDGWKNASPRTEP